MTTADSTAVMPVGETPGDRSTTSTVPASRAGVASTRMRILGWYMTLLAVALIGAFLVQRAVLVASVSTDVDNALDQEVGELRQLAAGVDPATGEPFGEDVAAIFTTFLSRNVALEGEAIVTIVDGEPYQADARGATLSGSPLIQEWAPVQRPVRADAATDEGTIRYLAVPLVFENVTRGVFVVTVLMDERLRGVNEALRIGAIVAGSIFLLASAIAWFAAGSVLRPLRSLSETAQLISDTDLSRRIPVAGDDELADLGRTFNSMLDRLEEAFAAQRRFVDDAGHELRTPITVIRGNLELMGEDRVEQAATVELVTDELDRMTRIVDDLLDLATSEQPDFVRLEPVDLGELTHDLAVRAHTFDGRAWIIDHVADAVVPADRHRLMQAAMNLVRNASEHTSREVNVAIGSRIEGRHAHLWVRDNGDGIAPEDRERLFERFFRGSGRRRTSGAGLGLAIVKAIAEAHGGSVTVESRRGHGSRFTILLPLEPTPSMSDENPV